MRDRIHLWFFGGARIRLTRVNGSLEIEAMGGVRAMMTERIVACVQELHPEAEGVIDVDRDPRRGLRLWVRGPVAEPDFVQHLRNMLVNL